MAALLAVLAAASVAAAAEPKTCALYFDFHEKKSPSRVSHLYFGEVADDGTFEGGQRADLGLQYDPQGQLTVAPDGKSLAFTGIDNRTARAPRPDVATRPTARPFKRARRRRTTTSAAATARR